MIGRQERVATTRKKTSTKSAAATKKAPAKKAPAKKAATKKAPAKKAATKKAPAKKAATKKAATKKAPAKKAATKTTVAAAPRVSQASVERSAVPAAPVSHPAAAAPPSKRIAAGTVKNVTSTKAAAGAKKAAPIKKVAGSVGAGPWGPSAGKPAELSESAKVALAVAEAALDKKAVNVEIIDVTGKVDYADFVVVMSGTSDRQVNALSRGIAMDVQQKTGSRCIGIEGTEGGAWVLMDFGDVIVHIFHQDVRGFYDLESLWIDAGRLPVPTDPRSRG